MKKNMRWICLLLGLALSFSMLAGCQNNNTETPGSPDSPDTPPTGSQPPASIAPPTLLPDVQNFNEAPMLAERVASGDLPQVDDRLPTNPKVADFLSYTENFNFEIGKYGGTLHNAAFIPNCALGSSIGCTEPLVTAPGITGDIITPNIVESFDVSADQRVFTFKMREGMKWSDGYPLTTEDVDFAWNDILLNEDLTASSGITTLVGTQAFPTYLRDGNSPGGKPGTFTVIDEYTFQISFENPYGGFLVNLAIVDWRNYLDLIKPKHYLKDFHASYADPAVLEKMVNDGGYESWAVLFGDKDIRNLIENGGSVKSIGFPVLGPFMCVYNDGATYKFERNPYYFKVDPAGNQLPYLDFIESTFYNSMESINIDTIAGKYETSIGDMPNIELYMRHAEQNGYEIVIMDDYATPAFMCFNYTFDNENFQKVVQDIRFRKALSFAIDRDEINDLYAFGLGTSTVWNDPEYSVDKANALLDEMGLDKKDNDGYRLGPDGKRFILHVEFPEMLPGQAMIMELVTDMWLKVGVFTDMKIIDMNAWDVAWNGNNIEATLRNGSINIWWMNEFLTNCLGVEYYRWHQTNGDQGVEPPADLKTFFELIDSRMTVSQEENVNVVFPNLRQLNNENCFYIILMDKAPVPFLVTNQVRNHATKGYAMANAFAIEQFWYDE